MSRSPRDAVQAYLDRHGADTRYAVAFSGGLDSHVLLSLLVAIRDTSAGGSGDAIAPVRAIHVDHGLQAKSRFWASHCRQICESLDVAFDVCTVAVTDTGDGREAAARRARYRAFAQALKPEEHLLLAQHADDQAETFLMQALRGSGPEGLASIPLKRHFHHGYMGRPLLAISRKDIEATARRLKLAWLEDPSNRDLSLDRNFLRHSVMPVLRERWPSLHKTLGRSASRCAAVSHELQASAENDLESLRDAAHLSADSLGSKRQSDELPYVTDERKTVSIRRLREHSAERCRSILRAWVRERGFALPRLQDLDEVRRTLIDKETLSNGGQVTIGDYEFRRHRDRLYLTRTIAKAESFSVQWNPSRQPRLQIPEVDLILDRDALRSQGIVIEDDAVLDVRSRQGGELIRLGSPPFHKAVKKLLQEADIPPWERERIPLLYHKGRLLAVWGIAIASDSLVNSPRESVTPS